MPTSANHNSPHTLKVGITMGDANGVGPELIIRTFMDARMRERCIPIVYGSSRVINIYRKVLGVNKFVYNVIQSPTEAQARRLNIIECIPDLERVDIGKPSEVGGKVAFQSLKRAIEDAQHQHLDAIVTLPVDKASMQAYDEDFSGHTELLAKAFNVSDNLMLMASDSLRVGVVTNHLAVKDVSRNLTVDRIVQKATILAKTLSEDFSIQRPMIALLGLNPHAGDRGLIGTEDQEIVAKAVEVLQEKNIQALGPYPADGFFGSLTYQKFDGTLAMYHDQGLIPFKVLAGYDGVNFTAGIPFVRTSPDHGVAYDIAGKGTADLSSVRQAIFLAIDIFTHRTQNLALKENALEIKPLKPERKKGR